MGADPLGPTLLILISILILTWILITYIEHKQVKKIIDNYLRLHSLMKME